MATYVAARDLASVPIGTHQFIVIVPDNPNLQVHFVAPQGAIVKARRLTASVSGFVIGAQNRSVNGTNRLIVEFFEPSDLQATREFFAPKRHTSWYKSDFDTEAQRVQHRDSDHAFIRQIFFLVKNFMINEMEENIPYPPGGIGYNSNSWAQTVIEIAGGRVSADFRGADVAHG